MTQIETDSENEITIKQERLLTNLLTCSSIDAAAKASDMGRTTVYRHLQDKAFRDELKRRRNQLADAVVDSFKAHSLKALDTLVGLLDSDNEGVRRKVANDVLGYVFRGRELQEAEERLAAVEERAARAR